MLTSSRFWKDTAERAIKTVAQASVALLTAGATGILLVNWVELASVAGLAGVISVLTSIASSGSTGDDSASLVKEVK